MTAAFTGAAIGFLVWAAMAFSVMFSDRYNLVPGKAAISLVLYSGLGAAIGWLIGRLS